MDAFWQGFEKQAVSVGWITRRSADAVKKRMLASGAPKHLFEGAMPAEHILKSEPQLARMSRRDLQSKGFKGVKADLKGYYNSFGKNFPKNPTNPNFQKSMLNYSADAMRNVGDSYIDAVKRNFPRNQPKPSIQNAYAASTKPASPADEIRQRLSNLPSNNPSTWRVIKGDKAI